RHFEAIEKHAGLLGIGIAIMVSLGGLAEITPLFVEAHSLKAPANVHPYDRPFQWGSKRTGPDLARVGGKYSDDWQRMHLLDPRSVVPQSNMPGYPWLAKAGIDGADIQARMRVLRKLGDPYS